MTHVSIRTTPRGTYELTVDGTDLSLQVLREGFKIELPNEAHEPARLHMVLAADVLDADLPHCVIETLRRHSTSETKRR